MSYRDLKSYQSATVVYDFTVAFCDRYVKPTDKSNPPHKFYLSDPADAANAMICLINQTNFLLDQQLRSLESRFVKEGGWGEALRHKREEAKKRHLLGRFYKPNPPNRSN